jgi:acetate kinase
VLRYLKELIPLTPLHEPHNVAGILAAREAWPLPRRFATLACGATAFMAL